MKLSVIGTGYVGLVQGAVFAEIGHDVICVDSLESKINAIENFCKTGKGGLPVDESGLPGIVKTNYDNGRLKFSTELNKAVEDSLAMFICVGTPMSDDGSCDMSYVYNVAEQIGDAMNYKAGITKLIVLKSTVPPNTYKEVTRILKSKTNNTFYVISNPEFMAQGKAVEDCRCPSRIVIGSDNKWAIERMQEIYHPIIKKRNVKIRITNNINAEISKYAGNTNLAVQITTNNKLARLTRELGGDWNEIKVILKDDGRIGHFVHQGLGYGGSCFEKDVLAVAHTMKKVGLQEECDWFQETINHNKKQRLLMVPRIKNYFENISGSKTVAVWGLSFKPDTNDVRGAASIPTIQSLAESGIAIRAYDPAAIANARSELELLLGCEPEKKGITFCHRKEDALKGSDALLITSEWAEFMSADLNEIKETLNYPAIFDGKDIYDIDLMKSLGFDYFSIGRPDVRR